MQWETPKCRMDRHSTKALYSRSPRSPNSRNLHVRRENVPGRWNERVLRAKANRASRLFSMGHTTYSKPTRKAIYTDGNGNWFTEEPADMADEAANLYRELAEQWGEYADFWEALAEKFEADPSGIPALVLGTGGTRS